MDPQDMTYINGDNMGGIPLTIYYGDHTQIATFSELTKFADAADYEELAKLDGPPIFQDGKSLKKLDVTAEAGSLIGVKQGELGGISSRNELMFQLDRLTKRNIGFDRVSNNGRLCFLVPDPDIENQYYAMGFENGYPAYRITEGELGTGEGAAGKKGASYKFVCNRPTLPVLVLTPEQLAVLLAPAESAS